MFQHTSFTWDSVPEANACAAAARYVKNSVVIWGHSAARIPNYYHHNERTTERDCTISGSQRNSMHNIAQQMAAATVDGACGSPAGMQSHRSQQREGTLSACPALQEGKKDL